MKIKRSVERIVTQSYQNIWKQSCGEEDYIKILNAAKEDTV